MNKIQKTSLVLSIKEALSSSAFIVLVHYRGLSDKQLYDFRVSLKSKGASLRIIKNTLAKVAIKGSDLDVLSKYLVGPTAICYTNDPVSLAKATMNSAKNSEFLKIQAAYMNKIILSNDDVDNLSKLGSVEEVRSSFLGVLSGSQSKFLRIINAPASGIISVINNYADSK